jgi:hypothetical protein
MIIICLYMLMRQERIALLLLLGVAALVIVAHGVLSVLGKQPFARPFTNTTADGELVFVEGSIEEADFTKTGNHVILRVRNLTIFIPSGAATGFEFRKGQNISVYGTVETYRGKQEIVVSSSGDIRLA